MWLMFQSEYSRGWITECVVNDWNNGLNVPTGRSLANIITVRDNYQYYCLIKLQTITRWANHWKWTPCVTISVITPCWVCLDWCEWCDLFSHWMLSSYSYPVLNIVHFLQLSPTSSTSSSVSCAKTQPYCQHIGIWFKRKYETSCM